MPRRKDHLSSSEVATLLGISRATLYNWLRVGKIPEPDRNELTHYPQWRPEDVQQIRDIIRAGGDR